MHAGIVRWPVPLDAAVDAWAHSGRRRPHWRFGVHPGGDRDLIQPLVRIAIECSEHAGLARGGDQIPRATADRLPEEWRNLGQVPIVRVAGQELIVPAQLAGADVERDEGIGIEIPPRPEMTGEVGGGVRDRDVQLLLRGIERERSPDRPTALGETHGILPGLRTRFTWTRHGVEPPDRLAVGESEPPDPSLDAVLAARGPDHHEVVVRERWHGDRLTRVWTGDVPCPKQLAVPGVEPQEIAVGGATHDIPPGERHATIHRPELVVSRLPRVSPPGTAGGGVDRQG